MRPLFGPPFDAWRVTSGPVVEHYGTLGDATAGAFHVEYMGRVLGVIASAGDGWDHVSVSLPDRCPTWNEMLFVKRSFFKPEEWAMELHPPAAENISKHPHCLHLWRPQDATIPLPPTYMVA